MNNTDLQGLFDLVRTVNDATLRSMPSIHGASADYADRVVTVLAEGEIQRRRLATNREDA